MNHDLAKRRCSHAVESVGKRASQISKLSNDFGDITLPTLAFAKQEAKSIVTEIVTYSGKVRSCSLYVLIYDNEYRLQ